MLEDEAWIVVDESLNDIPVLAWVDFDTAERTGLHEPVPCRLFTYHCHANVILDKVKEGVMGVLDERLHERSSE